MAPGNESTVADDPSALRSSRIAAGPSETAHQAIAHPVEERQTDDRSFKEMSKSCKKKLRKRKAAESGFKDAAASKRTKTQRYVENDLEQEASRSLQAATQQAEEATAATTEAARPSAKEATLPAEDTPSQSATITPQEGRSTQTEAGPAALPTQVIHRPMRIHIYVTDHEIVIEAREELPAPAPSNTLKRKAKDEIESSASNDKRMKHVTLALRPRAPNAVAGDDTNPSAPQTSALTTEAVDSVSREDGSSAGKPRLTSVQLRTSEDGNVGQCD